MNIPVFKTFPKYRHSKMIFSKLQAWRVFYYGDFGDGIYRLYGDITFVNRYEAESSAVYFRDTGEISLDMNTSAIRVFNGSFDSDHYYQTNQIRSEVY